MRIRASAIALLLVLAASLALSAGRTDARQESSPTATQAAASNVCLPDEIYSDAPIPPDGLTVVSRCGNWNPVTGMYTYQSHFTMEPTATASVTDESGTVEAFHYWGTTFISVISGSLDITITDTCPSQSDGFCHGGATQLTNPNGVTTWDEHATLPISITVAAGESVVMYNVTAKIAAGSDGADFTVDSTFENIDGGCSGGCFRMIGAQNAS